mmetsp:Transcript_18801/g.46672  ORF Transcript_18801/g.46672 Transcript_18801/m.46672 type:complete len:519 (+) Transcript_18801:49-1605(+)
MRQLSSLKALLLSLAVPSKTCRAFSSIAASSLGRSSATATHRFYPLPRYNYLTQRNMAQGVVIDDENCLVNTNPATGEVISKVKCTTPEEIEDMIEKAKVAQKQWRKVSVEDRIQMLKDCVTELAKDSDKLTELIVAEMGKPIEEAKEEVEFATGDQTEYFNIMLESLQPKKYGKSTVVRNPYGVSAIMSPWNFPLGEIPLLALPSLASGNTVILKPSEVVPETGAMWVQAFEKVLPPGVLQLAQGSGSVGASLVAHDGIDLVAMTGSSATGRKILESAAPQLKRVILEMGGKDPMIVCEDADLQKAAKDAVMYSLSNTGQVCCSVERIYVADAVYEEFQELTKVAAQDYKVGNGMDPANLVGPMVSSMQKELVHEQVEDAVAKGAKLLHQSEVPDQKGSFYPVTVLADVDKSMLVYTKETFGPVVAMTKFDGSEDEAVRLANDTVYGLGSMVYTQDSEKANRIASLIDAGQVGINCYPLEHLGTQCPWVGHKASGFGYHSGFDGCLQFSIPKTIIEG